jgi:predicted metalloprotease with PDZ domain
VRVAYSFAAIVFFAGAALAADTVKLDVDLTDAPRHIIHSTMTFQAHAGQMTLRYPKWLPGEHGPTGPIKNVAGIFVKANGKDIGWTREPKDMYAFRVDVPAGAGEIVASLDLLDPAQFEGFSSGASTTAKLAILSWNQVVLYPDGVREDQIDYEATLTLPGGWTFGTALPVAESRSSKVSFKPVSLTTLVDSPVLAGEYMRTVVLDDRPGKKAVIDMAADARADLAVPPELEKAYVKLVKEADALFGCRHYGEYHFLLTLSDHVPHFGLEHHQSSDDRVDERSYLDPDRTRLMQNLLPHEYVHSWNGKFRRPADLLPDELGKPIDSTLLWVYEGLTQYLGWVLASRSGVRPLQEGLDRLAYAAAELDTRGGRSWRNLEDTATAAQLLYESSDAWTAWRRSTDFYEEGMLIWLDADVTIRHLTKGQRSLDDFCKRFHGGGSGLPEVKTYTFADVVADLNAIAPNDWAKFLNDRVKRRDHGAPMGGIEGGGWQLTYSDTPTPFIKSTQDVTEKLDFRYSLGLLLDKTGAIVDVLPESKAWAAGISPGMKIVAINGRRFAKGPLRDAVKDTKPARATIKLLIEHDDYFREFSLDVEGGERHPVLSRKGSGEDVVGAILAPRTDSAYNKPSETKRR